MTNHTEARLAREAEIAYASLSMATDYDCWHESEENVSVEMVINNLQANATLASKIVEATAEKIKVFRPESQAHQALKDGLMTAKERVPENTRKKLDLLTSPYWGSLENQTNL